MSEVELDGYAWHRAVLDERCTLDPYESLIVLAMVKHAAKSDGEAWPGFGKLKDETRLSRSTVIRAVAELDRRGVLVRQRQLRGQAFGSNHYWLPLEPPLEALRGNTSVPSVPETPPSVPETLPLVSDRHYPSVPETPQLLIELPIGTTQGTTGKRKPNLKSHGKGKATPITNDWVPTDEHKAYCREHGLDLKFELDGLLGWAKGRTVPSWDGKFSERLANQAKWNKERAAGKGRIAVQTGYEERSTQTAQELAIEAEVARLEAEG